MRKLVLGLAVSLDGYIEGPKGEYDWCFQDQDYGMSDFFKRVDALFVGRRSYEMFAPKSGAKKKKQSSGPFAHMKQYIFSDTLKEIPDEYILISSENLKEKVNSIKNENGKDIWLFGGASLTSSLMSLSLVDEIGLAVHPILLGGGKPLFQNLKERIKLDLVDSKTYSTGLIYLTYNLKK